MRRRAVPQFLDQPLLVVLLDEVPHSFPHLFDVLKNPSIDGLLFQGAIEPLCDSVGFRLTDKRKTGIDAPIVVLGNLILTSDRPGFTAFGGFEGEPLDFTRPASSADKASWGSSRARPRWPSMGPRKGTGQCGWNAPKLPLWALVQIVRQRKFGRCRCLDPIPISITQPARLAISQAALRGARPACPT